MRRPGWSEHECDLYYQTIIECPDSFANCKTHLDYLVEMQHYGLPTRLLDVTKNPLIALYKVYIDWIDDITLDRTNVTPATASTIRSRIMNSTGTSYIATSNSTSSKWCPWELGVADGAKGKVCILPVMDDSFKGQEYLGLYPYIEYEKVKGKDEYQFWVYDQTDNRKYVILKDWLSGIKPYLHK